MQGKHHLCTQFILNQNTNEAHCCLHIQLSIQEINQVSHLDNLEVEIVYVAHSNVGFLGFASFL